MDQVPLFIPLKTEYYNAFRNGSKKDELRKYGPRWNHKTCKVGRGAILSKGYGKDNRMKGTITEFRKQHGTTFSSAHKTSILAIYGTLDVDIARITISGISDI